MGKDYELLTSDKHKGLLKKFRKDPSDYRPDITHQCLMMLLDSPLNRAGKLQIYIHTKKNVLIEVNPQTRIPRTFDRFCGLMVQLLHKLSVSAADRPQKLLKVIKNPITDHLPTGCPKFSTSFKGEPLNASDVLSEERPVVFVIGAIAKGSIDPDYAENCISFSSYPLSAALSCAKLCTAAEEQWGIV